MEARCYERGMGEGGGGVERRDGGKRVGRVIDKREGCAFRTGFDAWSRWGIGESLVAR